MARATASWPSPMSAERIRTLMLIGSVLLVSAGALYNLGVVLQSRVVRETDQRLSLNPRLLLHVFRMPVWLVGIALNFVAWICQGAALTYLPVSVVQPGLVVGLI